MKNTILKPLSRRLRLYEALTTSFRLWILAGIGVIVIVACDALIILPRPFRDAAPLLAACALAPLLIYGLARILKINAFHTARWIESRDESVGSVLTNAVQLADRKPISTAQAVLCRQAVEMGRQTAETVRIWKHTGRHVRAYVRLSAVVLALLLVLSICFYDVVQAVIPRLLDPGGDHPPYSRLKLDVHPGNTRVLYGSDLDIKVNTSGKPVDSLYLMAETGKDAAKLPMFLTPDHAFCQTLTHLTEETGYFVTDGRARSRGFKIMITRTPEIDTVFAHLEYPAYTGLGNRRITVGKNPIVLPVSTTVNFVIQSNRPLSSGDISMAPVMGGEISHTAMTVTKQTDTVTGTIRVDRSAIFTLSVTDINGRVSVNTRKGRIDARADERPRIYVLEPGKQAVATPESVIPLSVEAEDDYAVQQTFFFRGINGSVERPMPLADTPVNTEDQASNRRISAVNSKFDLKSLGVLPGDVIEYFFEAADNDPAGPNIATSRLYRLEIISVDEYREIVRRQAAVKGIFESYEKLGKWLGRLSDQAAHLKAAAEVSEKQLTSLKKKIKDYRQALQKILAAPAGIDIEALFHQVLQEQSQVIDGWIKKTDTAEPAKDVRESVNEITGILAGLTANEKTAITGPVKEIRAVALLMANAEKFSALYQRQAELVRLARRFSEPVTLSRTNRMELVEIARQEAHIQKLLVSLTEEIRKQADTLPDKPASRPLRDSAEQFWRKVDAAGIATLLADAADTFSALDGPMAWPKADEALDKMSRFLSQCNKLGDIGSNALQFAPSIQKHLGNTLQQILAGLGVGPGNSANGYSMLSESAALYGPETALPRTPSGNGGKRAGRNSPGGAVFPGEDNQATEKKPAAGSIEQTGDTKFPERYRKLIGDYFRKISESGTEQ